ncbi:MAG: hypothetical protein QOG03_322 [Actinomycetota bacterium]|jgi:hypothetical protein|nr:hypothetical protein [Actinomycetota bacterium]
MRRLALSFLAVLMTVLVLAPARPAAAASYSGEAEMAFLKVLNQARAGSGLGPMVFDSAASSVARGWTGQMAAQRVLGHNPNYVSQISTRVTNDWTRVGENVGYGPSVPSLQNAFWNSPGHKANELGDYNRVGIGAVNGDDGNLWITFDFIKGPAISGPTGLNECTPPNGWFLDGYGGIHNLGSAPNLSGAPYFGWDIARDLAVNSTGKGYVLDGFGGIHPVGGLPMLSGGGYWKNWDIANALAVTPDLKGAYVLDAFGGIHPFGNAPAITGTPYWKNWDIARDLAVDPTSSARGYELDGFGGLHPFGGMPDARGGKYFGADKARSIVMLPNGTGGYIVDSNGGLSPFAVGNNTMPPALSTAATAAGSGAFAVIKSGSGVVLTNSGGLVGVGSSCSTPAIWANWNIVRGAATA